MYEIHEWAHTSLVRVLLFNTFCGQKRLPTHDEVKDAQHLLPRLLLKLPEDVWHYTEYFILAQAFYMWLDTDNGSPWSPQFREWAREERGLAALYVDAVRWYEHESIMPQLPSSLNDIRGFLTEPRITCPDAADILALPLVDADVRSGSPAQSILPHFEPEDCVCGECAIIHSHMTEDLGYFRDQYPSIMGQASLRGCYALMKIWEPVLLAAEEWFESLLGRIESPLPPFVWSSDSRYGPPVLEVATFMGLRVGSNLSTETLLRFIVTLNSLQKDLPIACPRPLPGSGIGYLMKVVSPDQFDQVAHRQTADPVIFAIGDWLYDFVGSNGVNIVYNSDDLLVDCYSLSLNKFSPICMPSFQPDFPQLVPRQHAEPHNILSSLESDTEDVDLLSQLTIMLSNLKGHGFPLLSVADSAFPSPRGALAALIRATCLGRTIETARKPGIRLGSRCDHDQKYRFMTHCSPTAKHVLLQVEPSADNFIAPESRTWSELFAMETSETECRNVLRNLMQEHQRRTAQLQRRGAFFERHRICIVRCGFHDGPVDAIVVLAASMGKQVYIIHHL